MRCKPFESAASELVPESEHPLEQLRLLDRKVLELERGGDTDAIIECRIKQVSLHKVLLHLYGFPARGLVAAQCALSEAYAGGAYHAQAREYLARARETCEGGVHDDAQLRRLQVDLLLAEGTMFLAEDRLEPAGRVLIAADRLVREAFGERTPRAVRVRGLLGRVAQRCGRHADAAAHLRAALELHGGLPAPPSGETVRLGSCLAEALFAAGEQDEAIEEQQRVVAILQASEDAPAELLVNALSQLACWLEAQGREQWGAALESLQEAERIIKSRLGQEDPKAIDVKRDVAMFHIKLGDHETALRYLQDVEFLERRLHGSQSVQVARILKALGMVHMVRNHAGEAEQCLQQALRIFEADYPVNAATIRDIKAKLNSIASAAPG